MRVYYLFIGIAVSSSHLGCPWGESGSLVPKSATGQYYDYFFSISISKNNSDDNTIYDYTIHSFPAQFCDISGISVKGRLSLLQPVENVQCN